jgi:hypothetical protein
MSIKIHSIDQDLVINSKFITGVTTYENGLKELFPLIDKLDIQRKIQTAKFYKRLEKDLIKGCIMPPLTIAFISDLKSIPNSTKEAEAYFAKNINNAFILDGIQRLTTLNRTFKNSLNDKNQLDLKRPLYLNILVCQSMDNLLYRMITLNNGQRPMSASHQIEILASHVYNFDDLGITIQTEKAKGKNRILGSFNKADFIKAYLAFLSNSISIDNKKVIEEKLDELLANRILDSSITEDGLEFSDLANIIGNHTKNLYNRKWFENGNNLIGFSVGAKNSFELVKNVASPKLEENLRVLDKAVASLNLSTIKLSQERRRIAKFYFENYERTADMDQLELLDILVEELL